MSDKKNGEKSSRNNKSDKSGDKKKLRSSSTHRSRSQLSRNESMKNENGPIQWVWFSKWEREMPLAVQDLIPKGWSSDKRKGFEQGWFLARMVFSKQPDVP